eukprot:gene27769-33538_t
MDALALELAKVSAAILDLEAEIKLTKESLAGQLNKKDTAYYRRNLQQLRGKKGQLRDKELQLHADRLLLLQMSINGTELHAYPTPPESTENYATQDACFKRIVGVSASALAKADSIYYDAFLPPFGYSPHEPTFLPNKRIQALVARAAELNASSRNSSDMLELEYDLRYSLRLPDSFDASTRSSETKVSDSNLKHLLDLVAQGSSQLVVKKDKLEFTIPLAKNELKPEYRIEGQSSGFHLVCSECKGSEASVNAATPQAFQLCADSALHMCHKGLSVEHCVVPGVVLAGDHVEIVAVHLIPHSFPCLVSLSRCIHLSERWELSAWIVALREFALQSLSFIRNHQQDQLRSVENYRILLSCQLFFKPVLSKAKPKQDDVVGDTDVDASSRRSRLRIILAAYERLQRLQETHSNGCEHVLFPVGVMSFPTLHTYSEAVYKLLKARCQKFFLYSERNFQHVPLLVYQLLDEKSWTNTEKPPKEYRDQYVIALREVVDLLNEAGVAHMDLRPSNIMWRIDDSGRILEIRVIDFEDVCFFGTYIDFADILSEDRRYPVAPVVSGDQKARKVMACKSCNLWFYEAIRCFLLEEGRHRPRQGGNIEH